MRADTSVTVEHSSLMTTPEVMSTKAVQLVELVEKNYVHPKVAQAASPSPEEIKMRLRGIKTK